MKTYPYVVEKHNTIDALGHCILILTYTVTFILRVSDEELESEIFPREGYGFFIVFMYMFVLPAPTVYYFFKDSSKKQEDDADGPSEDSMGFNNPLQDGDFGNDDDATLAASNKKGQSSSTVRLAKLQREAKVMRAELATKDGELAAKHGELAAMRQEIVQLGGDATAAMHSAANAEKMAAMIATTKLQADAAAEAQAKAEAETHMWDARRPSQVLAIGELVQQGVLSEGSMDEAKQALEDHVATHLLSRRLKETQEREKLQLAVRRERDKLDATLRAHEANVQMSLSKQLPTADDARQSLNTWLETNRLARHKVHFLQVGGPESGLADLALITEDEAAEFSSVMTKMEARRFEAALKALANDEPDPNE